MLDNSSEEVKVDDSYTPVQPATEVISFVQIECRVVLYKAMYCFVHTYDVNKRLIKSIPVEITPEEYNAWVDDSVMEALILSKAGLSKL